MLASLIEETFKCPEVGKSIDYCGKIEDIVEIPGTVWSIARISGKTKIIEYTKMRSKNTNGKEIYFMRRKNISNFASAYYAAHTIIYRFTKFSIKSDSLSKEMKIYNQKKLWDGLFVFETGKKIYYVIVD